MSDSDLADKDLVQESGLKSSLSVSVPDPVSNSGDGPLPQPDIFDKSNNARQPRNFLIPSILVSILCFWPLGFAAIWQATKSQRAVKRGEYEHAKIHSNVAKSFIAFSVALGILQAAVMVTVVMLQLYVFPRYSYIYKEAIATTNHQ